MSPPSVFIDGQAGTTALRIRQLLDGRADLELRPIPDELRKDSDVRQQYLRDSDLAILCLPDETAAEAVELLGNADTRVIDTSSARRVHCDWVYGLPELGSDQREAIRSGDRVANPGCYPQSFILAVRPLIEAGVLDANAPYTVNAVSGYSGGGRQMIEAYHTTPPTPDGDAGLPLSLYGLEGHHKHLPEMQRFAGVEHPPLFVPSVDHTYSGMLVSVPIARPAWQQTVDRQAVFEIWHEHYGDEPLVAPLAPTDADAALRDGKFLDLVADDPNALQLLVYGNPDIGLVLVGRLDNLGKGAGGSAVQCLNLMLGFPETKGLV
ncbi:MAG: N-acetyl-gamma-glutamyl-phosphate reductase [Candidatus Latescibacterota bacterium]|nr:N-acetyl-gamma-glutamyl-phosphate reductase [Candidatus Latescibacterota bacterium]